jgi:phage gpG-like protein
VAGAKVSFSGLSALKGKVQGAADPKFRADLARVLGATALKQLADEFRGERDPYGKAWAPLQLRKGKILRDTGRMAASAAVVPRPGGFELVISAHYARTHQKGALITPKKSDRLRFKAGRGRSGRWYSLKSARIPRRQMLPEPGTGGFGPIWTSAFQKQADDMIRRHFKSGGK